MNKKYYVKSGDHEVTLMAVNTDEAVQKFFNHVFSKQDEASFGVITKVSESGFSMKGKRHKNDVYYDTDGMLNEIEKTK